jgi:hypothetical protein
LGIQKEKYRRGLLSTKRSLLAVGIPCIFAVPAIAQCTGHAQLSRFERIQFVEVSLGQRVEVSAQFLSELGCGKPMLEGLRSLGATIRYSDEQSGYALILISKDKVLETLDLPGIAYAYTRDDDRIYYQDPAAKVPQSERKPTPIPPIAIPYPRVAITLPADGPYFATKEIGLDSFWKQHPEADGRGVRVAVADEGFDLLHPALQHATDATGKTVPKIADLGTLTGPDEDSGWVRFGDPVHTTNGSFDATGRTWTVPEDGTYRFGIFKADLVLGPEDNSKTKKLSLSVGVIWNEHSNRVWVDTDSDGSFKNQRTLGDYSVTHDVDWFGAKEGADDNRIPFGVKIDAAQNAVYVRIGGEHGAFVGGPLAGNRLTGGLFDGTAPNAQLIDENFDVNRMPSIVAMFARPDVDVVNRSGGLGRAGYTGNREGTEDFAQRVLERVIAVYNKPIATYSAAVGTIHVNDYAGPEMLRRNRQLGPPYQDTINSFVWDLPSGLVNVVVAPSANLETDSRYKPQDIIWPDGKRHNFSDDSFNPPAPDGYVIGANNSPAIPVVSGLLADLISEAKREHIRYNATRLNSAVFTGARLVDDIPVSQQGYGLVNAEQSWNQLSKMAQADDPKNPELTSFAVAQIKDEQKVDAQGFHLDLSKPGEKTLGEIWITRHGGYADGRKYAFSLRGNDGSFELLDHQATLVRGKATRVRLRTNGASGWNIVFLELRDAKANVVMQDVPLSVRVPDVPETIAVGVDKYESMISPLRSEHEYVRVGDEVQASRYEMRIPYTGPCCSIRSFPGGRYEPNSAPPGTPLDAIHHVGPLENFGSLVLNDEPGTQDIFWENRGRPEYATQYDGPAPDVPIHASLTVTKYAVVIAKTEAQTLSVTNQLADVEGHVELYDAKIAASEMKAAGNHAMAEIERDLPASLVQWRVRVTGPFKRAYADAYLFNCTDKKGNCHIVSQQQITDKGALLVADKPQAGSWKIIVRSRELVTAEPTYKLSEAQLMHTQAGIVEADTRHNSGEKWTVALPTTTQYAAFRIAGTPGVEREKNGLLIAMSQLDGNAP